MSMRKQWPGGRAETEQQQKPARYEWITRICALRFTLNVCKTQAENRRGGIDL